MQTVTLSIAGMSCCHCVASVRAALDAVPGAAVHDVRVGSAKIALGAVTPVDALVAAVREAGYHATVASTTAEPQSAAIAASDNGGCACCAPAPAVTAIGTHAAPTSATEGEPSR
jgi:Cu+-exporting ATPase